MSLPDSTISNAAGNALAALSGAALSNKISKRAQRLAMLYVAGKACYDVYTAYRSKIRAEGEYVITVPSDDDLYEYVLMWVLSEVPRDELRSLSVRLGPWGQDLWSDEQTVRVLFSGAKPQDVVIGGHKVSVQLEHDDSTKIIVSSGGDAETRRKRDEITFTCNSTDARDAVIDLLTNLPTFQAPRKNAPRLFIANQWGDWTHRGDLPTRDLSTVILPQAQKNRIVEDFERFRELETTYEKLGLPYHRGYLFHGPPGTGKTSFARALASHFDMNVYYLSLGAFADDSNFLDMVSKVPGGSVLLIEDVDVLMNNARKRSDKGEEKGVTLSALLNAIDGVITPHGLVLIMTTNDIKALDKALIRTGRIDLLEKIDLITAEQADGLFRLTFPDHVPRERFTVTAPTSPADVIEILKGHLDDPTAAAAALRERLTSVR